MLLVGVMPNKKESLEAISQRLMWAQKALHFPTQTAFSAAIPGMTPQKWNNYLSCRDLIPVDVALVLCQRFRLSLDYIYRAEKDALPLNLVRKLELAEAGKPVDSDPKPRRS